jgi:hypothetical protein
VTAAGTVRVGCEEDRLLAAVTGCPTEINRLEVCLPASRRVRLPVLGGNPRILVIELTFRCCRCDIQMLTQLESALKSFNGAELRWDHNGSKPPNIAAYLSERREFAP